MAVNLTKIAALIVLLTICGASLSPPVLGQQTSKPKPETLRRITYDGTMANLLAVLADTFDVTIGLEIDARQSEPQVNILVEEAKLPDVLNAIVKSAPGYQWRESDGCIEVLPAATSSLLLDTLISNFRVHELDQTEATNRLMSLPDVRARMRAMGLNRKDSGAGTAGMNSKRFSMNIEGVPMRRALSMITSESGGRFWIFRSFGDGFFSISNSAK